MPEVLDISGAVNLRDFGGYTTAAGERVKSNVLYRSGMMTSLDEQGRRDFLDLGISVICDLRHHSERDREPTPFPAELPRQVLIPLDPGRHFTRAEAQPKQFQPMGSEQERVAFMTGINIDLARDHSQDYRRMFDELLDPKLDAFLVHCSAGKDRTGFAVGIILRLLGVEQETVMQDYLLTNAAMNFETFNLPRLRERYGDHITLEDARGISGVREAYLSAAFNELDRVWGSFENYLVEGVGLSDTQQAQLKQRYLV